MAAGASGSQSILTSSGYQSLQSLYSNYVSSGSVPSIAYVEPTAWRTVRYMSVRQVFNRDTCLGVRLITEDGITCLVPEEGMLLDLAEDYPPRPTFRHPTDVKCLVGPNMDSSGKRYVRKIVKREFVMINVYTVPVPNMIAKGGFIILA